MNLQSSIAHAGVDFTSWLQDQSFEVKSQLDDNDRDLNKLAVEIFAAEQRGMNRGDNADWTALWDEYRGYTDKQDQLQRVYNTLQSLQKSRHDAGEGVLPELAQPLMQVLRSLLVDVAFHEGEGEMNRAAELELLAYRAYELIEEHAAPTRVLLDVFNEGEAA